MIPELKQLIYTDGLKQCSLTTQDTSRIRADHIEVFKSINGYEDIDKEIFVKYSLRNSVHWMCGNINFLME